MEDVGTAEKEGFYGLGDVCGERLRLRFLGSGKGSSWAPCVIVALNFAIRTTKEIVIEFRGLHDKKRAPLPADELERLLGEMLHTSVFPPVDIIGSAGNSPSAMRCSVCVKKLGPGSADMIIAPATLRWQAFCAPTHLMVRSGAGVVPPDVRRWNDALQVNVDWHRRPQVRLCVGESVPWAAFPDEDIVLEYKSEASWPVSAAGIEHLCCKHLGPLLRSCREFTLTLGVSEKTRLPMGLCLGCTNEEARRAVERALGSFIPRLSLEEAFVTIRCVQQLGRENLTMVAEEKDPSACGRKYLKRVDGKLHSQLALLVEDVEEIPGQAPQPRYFLAGQSSDHGDPLSAEADLLPLHVVSVTVRLSDKGTEQQACCMRMPAHGIDAWPTARTVDSNAGQFSSETVPFDPLEFIIRSRSHAVQQGPLRAAAAMQHCFQAVLFAGEQPQLVLPAFEMVDAGGKVSLADLANGSCESFALVVVVLTRNTWMDVAIALLVACRAMIHEEVQLVVLLDAHAFAILPEFLAHMRLLDDKPCRLVDVLLTPPVPDTFVDAAAAAGLRLFTGRDEPPAGLLLAARQWLTDGSPLPPAAFIEGIIPVLNNQAQQVVSYILALLSQGCTGVQTVVVSQLFRCSGTSTLLRQAAAMAAHSHEELVFVYSQRGARWTSALTDLLSAVPGPMVVVVEDDDELELLKAAPAALLIILSSELILGHNLHQDDSPFVVSPLVDRTNVGTVCDALAAIFPAKAEAILTLRPLSESRKPLQRHMLVFLIVALYDSTYDVMDGGVEGYVRHELLRLPQLDWSGGFLLAVSFVGAFASAEHRFLGVASYKEELRDMLERSSLLIPAALHPWVAKEMLLMRMPNLFGPDLLTKGLVGALEAIDSTSQRLDVLKHLLFHRSGKDFSVLMQWCTNYLAPGQDSDDNRERHIVFPFTDLRHFVTMTEGQQFEAHCHLLWSRVLREACRLDEALVEAKLAVELVQGTSFSARQNCGLVMLFLGERQLRDGNDSSLLRSALNDYVILHSEAVEAGSKRKLVETAVRFLRHLPKKDAKAFFAVFGLNKDMLGKSPGPTDAPESYFFERAFRTVNLPAHNMPAMQREELDAILGLATRIECIAE